MNLQNSYQDAIDIVSGWDIPDEEYSEAVNDQARLMAGINIDEISWIDSVPDYSNL